jgi:hypothetical protein
MNDLFLRLGPLLNESLSAAIAVISGSFFLYSLVKDIDNRVARAFSALLFFVTVTYIGDMGVSFSGSPVSSETWLRFQWLGIAFVPAAYVHLSDAILAMTGLVSRGRRRWGVRFLYFVAAIFFVLVATTDLIVRDPNPTPAPHFRPGPLFWLFLIYFISSVVLSLFFVIRARRRTLTASTRRRFTYLLLTYAAPAIGVFPFLLVSGNTEMSSALFYAVLMLADAILAVMLTFMSYVMAFFASLLPDRLIKAQMLQFFLRGPVVAIATLAVIVWVPRAGAVLGIPGEEVMPFLAVTLILSLQWAITIARPKLEDWLIYSRDQREITRVRELEERLLTAADFHQLLDSILAALCDYLRVEAAFVASVGTDGPHLERDIGLHEAFSDEIADAEELASSRSDLPQPAGLNRSAGDVFLWNDFWLIPLFAQRTFNGTDEPEVLGLLGVSAPHEPISPEQEERWQVLMALATRAAEVLEDRRLQQGVFHALEGMLPETSAIRRLRGAARYGRAEALASPAEMIISPDFVVRVKDALGQYWGGPKLTDTALMSLSIVRHALDDNEGNAQRAMRAVLQQAIENLRPEGQRSMTTTEWILYNILEMRFIQGRKVRDVAMRLAMSESDLYRKQRVAIESVATIIAEMERAAANGSEADGAGSGAPKAAQS